MNLRQDVTRNNTLSLRSDLHLARKLWHMGIGSLILYIYLSKNLDARIASYGLMALSTLAFLVDYTRLKFNSLNKIVLFVLAPFMRESERTSLSGLPFYALGASLSLFLFEEKIALLSISFLIFADPISSFVGILYGKDKILKNKSFQGSLAGFVTCYFAALSYGVIYSEANLNLLIFSILGGFIGAISELCSVYVDDNLTIPVISGAGLSLINLFLHVF